MRALPAIGAPVQIGLTLPHLKGCWFFCKGTNKRMRDLARRPMENGSVIRILDDCSSYEIVADLPVKPTSELPSHLAVHNDFVERGLDYRASLHTHPIELVAMSHTDKFLKKDVLSNLLWSMIPETKAFCPRGLGIVEETWRLRRGLRYHGGLRPGGCAEQVRADLHRGQMHGL